MVIGFINKNNLFHKIHSQKLAKFIFGSYKRIVNVKFFNYQFFDISKYVPNLLGAILLLIKY